MKIFRYKKPSYRTIIGYTSIKRRIKRSAGISQLQAYTRISRIKQRAKYNAGIYSMPIRTIRQTSKGRLPSLLGLFKKK